MFTLPEYESGQMMDLESITSWDFHYRAQLLLDIYPPECGDVCLELPDSAESRVWARAEAGAGQPARAPVLVSDWSAAPEYSPVIGQHKVT